MKSVVLGMEAANPSMTFDEVSMEQSKSFVKALQELKNLRPQLYSAAEYCEKSYLHSKQKQMVLDNLKDYAVRALVNAVDHLGTVAYKLTDLLEQQNSDASTMDLKLSTLNQRLLTCQIYTGKEGLRQQQLLALIPRHHKHYILPSMLNCCEVHLKLDSSHKKVHFRPRLRADASLSQFQAKVHTHHSGTPAAKTLSWHLASETKSTLRKSSRSSTNSKDQNFLPRTTGVFQLLDNEDSTQIKSSREHNHLPNGGSASSAAMQTLGITDKYALKDSGPLPANRSFDKMNWHEREMALVPVRSKSMLSAFFAKQKRSKLKAGYLS